ncbi:ribosomal protection-like ABC-F family protein [Halobacillus litoralis]|uniref:ABC transporter domain-containing protein n=1 Tax=Halobacillus litoralis TaxID=45668 RepID=A0A410MAL8_9BACI|nr:ATP-binding cassette domain-containing protein [Halobacillus litoralis]QAS51747.1 hypothetical protein HLI_05630 [Halobacillus litoralis]
MLKMKAMNIRYEIGEREILNIKELRIHEGERIGLVGKNGEGKTLLIKYLMGELDVIPQIEWHTTYGWMKQLNEDLEISPSLSGGEKTLAKLESLFENGPPLLFLDEPTNNLDWHHVEKLEDELLQHKGAYVIVSHDRMLLNRTCEKIWELDDGKIRVFNGDYFFYEEQKRLEIQKQYEKHEQYLKEKKRIEERVRQKRDQSKGMRKPPKRMGNSEWQLGKNKAAAQQKKVERVSKTLERRLERIEKVEKPMEWEEVKMEFEQIQPVTQKMIGRLEVMDVVAGQKLLFRTKPLVWKTGSKTALIGKNGAGKSTLIQCLLNSKEWFPDGVEIGYLHQALEEMPLEEMVYDYVSEGSPLSETNIRIILARLKFFTEDMNKLLYQLSGGERVKLGLARLMTSGSPILILDEPTNHLDLEAIKALEQLIVDYPGTILFVSHDREFINRTADQLWMIENGEMKGFDGTWAEWQEYLQSPPEADEEVYDQMALETKLSELVSRLSVPGPKDKLEDLETAYQDTLAKLKMAKRK